MYHCDKHVLRTSPCKILTPCFLQRSPHFGLSIMRKVINEIDDFFTVTTVVNEKLQETTFLVMMFLETSKNCTIENINKTIYKAIIR